MGRNHESVLVKGCKGDDVAVKQRRHILMAGMIHSTEKTMLDEALHACMGNIGVVP